MLETNLKKIEKFLSLLLCRVKNNTIAGFTDEAKKLEFVIKEIFNVCYGYNLRNTNQTIANAAYIDLKDIENNISVQVTVNFDKPKLHQTLDKSTFVQNGKVYLVGFEKVSTGKAFKDHILIIEKRENIQIIPINGDELYRMIVGVADPEKIYYLLSTLEEHIDVNSLEVFNDEIALKSILQVFRRDAVLCHYSCEGNFDKQLKGLEEVKAYIHRGVIDGTRIASNKPLNKFQESPQKRYLVELDDLLQDMIRALRKGYHAENNFYFSYDQFQDLEQKQNLLINALDLNQYDIQFNLYR
ncbi:SMEK domain-containing protein [Acinetobacter pittii]|uniref:SMEK domain-containing protein n=1 Tax=Acinetobacter pittii TaxID=48296 RepID=UPI002FEF3E15